MATLTVRLPDDKHMRLKALAKRNHISINKIMEELSTQAIAEFDTEVRFRAMAAKGDIDKGLAILDKLDSFFRPNEYGIPLHLYTKCATVSGSKPLSNNKGARSRPPKQKLP